MQRRVSIVRLPSPSVTRHIFLGFVINGCVLNAKCERRLWKASSIPRRTMESFFLSRARQRWHVWKPWACPLRSGGMRVSASTFLERGWAEKLWDHIRLMHTVVWTVFLRKIIHSKCHLTIVMFIRFEGLWYNCEGSDYVNIFEWQDPFERGDCFWDDKVSEFEMCVWELNLAYLCVSLSFSLTLALSLSQRGTCLSCWTTAWALGRTAERRTSSLQRKFRWCGAPSSSTAYTVRPLSCYNNLLCMSISSIRPIWIVNTSGL